MKPKVHGHVRKILPLSQFIITQPATCFFELHFIITVLNF